MVPRQSIEDDIYRGMFIPKGSTILVNPTYADSSLKTSTADEFMIKINVTERWHVTNRPTKNPSASLPNGSSQIEASQIRQI